MHLPKISKNSANSPNSENSPSVIFPGACDRDKLPGRALSRNHSCLFPRYLQAIGVLTSQWCDFGSAFLFCGCWCRCWLWIGIFVLRVLLPY